MHCNPIIKPDRWIDAARGVCFIEKGQIRESYAGKALHIYAVGIAGIFREVCLFKNGWRVSVRQRKGYGDRGSLAVQ